MSDADDRFWETTPLSAMTRTQWESLCDGCAKCCLEKLEDEDTRQIYYTNVACRLLDGDTCRCIDYEHRQRVISNCVLLTPAAVEDPYWLPSNCAYRLVREGKALPDWHPLVSGDTESVHRAGQSVRGRVIPEEASGPLIHHLVDWVD